MRVFELSLILVQVRRELRNVKARNAMHGPDPSPDLSQVRSACLNTNLHPSPAWSMGLHPGFGPDRHQGESTETHRACALGG